MELPPPLRRFARLEQVLAVLLFLTPAVFIAFDGDVRASISAYHDMGTPEAFFVPLTVAATLFFVNGILRDAHIYNSILGIALLGVILFDHESASELHTAFAGAFFAGNVVVMMLFSTQKSMPLKVGLAAGIAGALVLWKTTSLFWAEWVSLAIIALHYLLDSVSWSRYRALEPGEPPKLAP